MIRFIQALLILSFSAGIRGADQTKPVLSVSQQSNYDVVRKYVSDHYTDVFRNASGELEFPYLVPAGPYEQCWDWDSVFTGVALLDFGSAPYLAGSMMNFFQQTNLSTGDVTICVDPTDPHPSCSSRNDSDAVAAHAKPLLIQGALIAAQAMDDFDQFRPFDDAMEATLSYWNTTRRDPTTGLYSWHDSMESGADNLATWSCPSSRSDCWVEAGDGDSIASSDVMTQLAREHLAYATFCETWAAASARGTKDTDLEAKAIGHRSAAAEVVATMNKWLYNNDLGRYMAFNVTSQTAVLNNVYLMGIPLWGGFATAEQASRIVQSLFDSAVGMWSRYGIRSTSSKDPLYSNADIIYPYSNWRGPIWVNANAMLAYGLAAYGYQEQALEICHRVTAVLANDIVTTGTWHEAYVSSPPPLNLNQNALQRTLLLRTAVL